MSPTQRTLAAQKKLGRTCQVVEKWNPYGGARKPDGTAVGNRVDLFGVIDVIALDPVHGIIGIQATSGGNVMARVHKSLAEPRLVEWLRCNGRFEVWGWRKLGNRWHPRVVDVRLDGESVTFQERDEPAKRRKREPKLF